MSSQHTPKRDGDDHKDGRTSCRYPPVNSGGLFADIRRTTEISRNPLQPVDMLGHAFVANVQDDSSSDSDDDDNDDVVNILAHSTTVLQRPTEDGDGTSSSQEKIDFRSIAQTLKECKTDEIVQPPSLGETISSKFQVLAKTNASNEGQKEVPKTMTAKQSNMSTTIMNQSNYNSISNLLSTNTGPGIPNSSRFVGHSLVDGSHGSYSGDRLYGNTNIVTPPHSPRYADGQSSNPRMNLLDQKLRRRTDQLLNSLIEQQQKDGMNPNNSSIANNRFEETVQANRRFFKVGDYVLVRNAQSKWATLVNRHGFPEGEGESEEERRGPYQFVLATITKVHFEEMKAYYTVTRCDTGADQRADIDFMEPLRSPRGELAALKAATGTISKESANNVNAGSHINSYHSYWKSVNSRVDNVQQDTSIQKRHTLLNCYKTASSILICPFVWLYDTIRYMWDVLLQRIWFTCFRLFRRQARLVLNGKEPYVCRMRLTIVNVVVVCSTWIMFADQARLAFFPPSADEAVAIINVCAWLVLVLELFLEVFIRPDGFSKLIISEKAFLPTTVLYVNSFHLVVESISLLLFIPEFLCILKNENCSQRYPFSFHNAALMKVIGPTRLEAAYGYAYFALIRLRVLGLVRHWKNMWISNTFINQKWMKSRQKQQGFLANIVPQGNSSASGKNQRYDNLGRMKNSMTSTIAQIKPAFKAAAPEPRSKESALTNASNIGTALMVINSYRTLAIMWAITGLFPFFICLMSFFRDDAALQMTVNLQEINLLVKEVSLDSCSYLTATVSAWISAVITQNHGDASNPALLALQISPSRCNFDGLIQATPTLCDSIWNLSNVRDGDSILRKTCDLWTNVSYAVSDHETIGDAHGIRAGSITTYSRINEADFSYPYPYSNLVLPTNYTVSTSFDNTYSIRMAALSSLLLQFCLLIGVLGGLSALRRDAEVLVLGPLRRMLRIVARYAKNPLVPPKVKRRHSSRARVNSSMEDSLSSDDDDDDDSDTDDFALGSYETEQLITAVAKITDLLRKCWGVAGADIISTNLASREGALTEVFNPTVPGKSVYALFGFAAIGGFDNAVRNLGGDIMPLINDIAAVLHGEVFRWGFGDSGQCNKNLGGAFLMVFRIGLVKDVIEKLEEATNVVFNTKTSEISSAVKKRRNRNQSRMSFGSSSLSSTPGIGTSQTSTSVQNRKKQRNDNNKAMSLSLQSLPGITAFTDRAVIGMLKSYAGIYRDKKVLAWNEDFRLGAGVGAFSISMIYGMDAGWAVEGAVGSEYKIDATYLSPHVNMASRMTSACKQYGVTIMLSQAVQELMSDVGQTKLRHLDTVTVKGSSVKQKIYTYDARARGVDFFLYSRSDEQADYDAERVSSNIWNNDQDLKAMRQHVTDEFLSEFRAGHKAFLGGDWPTALKRLERANDIMFETAFDEGYLEDEFDALQLRAGEDAKKAAEELRHENGDGPSAYLIDFMKSYGGIAPKNWDGWHPLTRK